MRLIRSFYLFLMIGITANAFGQVPSADSIAVRQASAQSDTLVKQFDELFKRLGSNRNTTNTSVAELWQNVNDSLNLQKKITETKQS